MVKRVRKTGESATEYNRAMLKGAGDEGATPEFGRFAARYPGKTSKGKPKPERIITVDEGGREPTAAEIKRETEISTSYNRMLLKGRRDKDATPELGRLGSQRREWYEDTSRSPAVDRPQERAKGGSVGGPKRKAYANGGSVRAARF